MHLRHKIALLLTIAFTGIITLQYLFLSTALGPASRLLDFSVLAIAAAPLLFACIIGAFYANHISSSILGFTGTIENISRGKLDSHIHGKERADELGDLARAFDRVLVSLKIAVEKVGLKKEELKLGEALEAKIRAEREQKLAEERYRTLAHTSPDCITLLDKNGKTLFINKTGLAEHGITEGASVDFITTVLRDPYQKTARTAITNALRGKTTTIEVQHKTKSETEWSLETLTPVRDEHGNITSILCVGRNVTSLKNTQQALETERTFVTNMIENAGVPIIAYDRGGKLLMTNKTLTTFSGYDHADFKHQNTWLSRAFTTPEAQQKVKEAITTALMGKAITDFVVPLTCKNGTTTIVAANIAPIHDAHGNINGTVHFMRDLSEIFTLEQQVFSWVNQPTDEEPRNIQISPQRITTAAHNARRTPAAAKR